MSDLTLHHSSYRALDVAVTDAAGDPLDITQSTLYWTVRSDWLSTGTPLIEKVSNNGIALINGPGGLAQVTIAAADWTGVADEPARLVWELTEKDSQNRVHRLDWGVLHVIPAVTEVP